MQAELAAKALEHGRYIFVYNNLRTNQVIYSLTRSIVNHDSIKQIPFNGKKSVPASVRKDLWRPLATVTFPNGYQGEIAYQGLREYGKRHQLEWRQEDQGEVQDNESVFQLEKKLRGNKLMDQKATCVSDIARVLQSQEAEIQAANEYAARIRAEDVAAFEAEIAIAENLTKEISELKAKFLGPAESLNDQLATAIVSQSQRSQNEILPPSNPIPSRRGIARRLEGDRKETPVDSWRRMLRQAKGDRKKKMRVTLTDRASRRELKRRLADCENEIEMLQEGHTLGANGAAVRLADHKAYADEKEELSKFTSRLAAHRVLWKLRIIELESQLHVSKSIQDAPDIAESYNLLQAYIPKLEAVRDILKTPKGQRHEGWEEAAKDLGFEQPKLNDLQQEVDKATAQLIEPTNLQRKIEILREKPPKVSEHFRSTLRTLIISHAKGVRGAAARRAAAVKSNGSREVQIINEDESLGQEAGKQGENSRQPEEQGENTRQMEDPGENAMQPKEQATGAKQRSWKGVGRIIAQNRGDPDVEMPSMEGVKIDWANILDAEVAETWPDAVVHDAIGLVKHVAPEPSVRPFRSLLGMEHETVENIVHNLARLEELLLSQGEIRSQILPSPVPVGDRTVRTRMYDAMREALVLQAYRESESMAQGMESESTAQNTKSESTAQNTESEAMAQNTPSESMAPEKVDFTTRYLNMPSVRQELARFMDAPPSSLQNWAKRESARWAIFLRRKSGFPRAETSRMDAGVRNFTQLRIEFNKSSTAVEQDLILRTLIDRELERHSVQLVEGSKLQGSPLVEAMDYISYLRTQFDQSDTWGGGLRGELRVKLASLDKAARAFTKPLGTVRSFEKAMSAMKRQKEGRWRVQGERVKQEREKQEREKLQRHKINLVSRGGYGGISSTKRGGIFERPNLL